MATLPRNVQLHLCRGKSGNKKPVIHSELTEFKLLELEFFCLGRIFVFVCRSGFKWNFYPGIDYHLPA